MSDKSINLIIVLAHELGCSLEMSYDAVELREIWPDAVEALGEAKSYLIEKGFVPPDVINNVLKAAASGDA